MTCAPSKDSDQPGHLPSLIRVFAVRLKTGWVLRRTFNPSKPMTFPKLGLLDTFRSKPLSPVMVKPRHNFFVLQHFWIIYNFTMLVTFCKQCNSLNIRPNHCGHHLGKINGHSSTYVKVWRCTFGRITRVLMGKSWGKLLQCQAEMFIWLTKP